MLRGSRSGCRHARRNRHSRCMVVRSRACCSSTSSARLLQGRGLPPRPADGVGGWRSRGTDQGCGGSDCVPRGGHVGPDGTVRGLTPSARRVTFAEASPGRQARGRRSGDRDSAIVVMPRRVFGRSGPSAETRGPTPPARQRHARLGSRHPDCSISRQLTQHFRRLTTVRDRDHAELLVDIQPMQRTSDIGPASLLVALEWEPSAGPRLPHAVSNRRSFHFVSLPC